MPKYAQIPWQRGIEGIGIVDAVENISCDRKHVVWTNVSEGAIILYAKQHGVSKRVGESADGLEDVFLGLIATAFEFDALVFILFDDVLQLIRVRDDRPYIIVS